MTLVKPFHSITVSGLRQNRCMIKSGAAYDSKRCMYWRTFHALSGLELAISSRKITRPHDGERGGQEARHQERLVPSKCQTPHPWHECASAAHMHSKR
eukprot:4912040-Pleurochrysis_carterae.AAC.8